MGEGPPRMLRNKEVPMRFRSVLATSVCLMSLPLIFLSCGGHENKPEVSIEYPVIAKSVDTGEVFVVKSGEESQVCSRHYCEPNYTYTAYLGKPKPKPRPSPTPTDPPAEQMDYSRTVMHV